jgi:hypothetical protein
MSGKFRRIDDGLGIRYQESVQIRSPLVKHGGSMAAANNRFEVAVSPIKPVATAASNYR